MENIKIKLLLVEDDPDQARLVQEMLSKAKGVVFEVEWFDRLSKSLERLSEGDINVILLDLNLPDSVEIDTFIKTSVQAPSIPIVVLTGINDESLAAKAVQLGAQDYLVKSLINANFLVRSIRYAIERKRTEEALRAARNDLEMRVIERTNELSKVNELLKREIVGRKWTEEQLMRNAFYDSLTGLPNRSLLMDRLEFLIKRSKRQGNYLFAVLFLDIDRFKVINDSLGHMFGDQLLIAIARRLELCVRPTDTVARFGGDEFVILLDGIEDVDDATRVSERIQNEIKLPFNLDGERNLFASASIGIAISNLGYDNPEEILRDADTAMYRAKALGKARHQVFDASMHSYALAMLHLEAELRRAIECKEFIVHYQPILSLVSGKITGVEVLVRWNHPQNGLIYPKEFIPIAEETGLIVQIGEWVLRMACNQQKAWRDAGLPPLNLAVNLSARQFENQSLPELIKEVLEETGMSPHNLTLEITESIAMKDIDFTIKTLKELRDTGIKVSIDDFGTGYSSLAYLQSFPINTLKIEQSFVKDILDNSDKALMIITAIIAMANSLELKIIAEGVERQEQLELLYSRGCIEIQGNLFSEPATGEDIIKLIKGEPHLLCEPKKVQIYA
jgi:diguanylate cyclase (GGDEF)-like protein